MDITATSEDFEKCLSILRTAVKRCPTVTSELTQYLDNVKDKDGFFAHFSQMAAILSNDCASWCSEDVYQQMMYIASMFVAKRVHAQVCLDISHRYKCFIDSFHSPVMICLTTTRAVNVITQR